MTRATLARAACSHCGRLQAVRADGTMFSHGDCPGTARPLAAGFDPVDIPGYRKAIADLREEAQRFRDHDRPIAAENYESVATLLESRLAATEGPTDGT